MDLVDRLKYAWPRKYKTRTAFAEAAKISKQYLSGILNRAKGEPSPETERGLAAALGIDRSALVAEDDETFFAALEGHDPTAPEPEPPDEPTATGQKGLLRPYRLASTVAPNGVVDGMAALIGAEGDAAALAKALPLEKGRRGLPDAHRVVGLAGVHPDVVLADLPTGLAICDTAEQVLARWPKGYVLMLRPGRHMVGDEADLVLAVHDGGPEAKSYLMRWRRGPEGEDLLYAIDGSKRGVSTEQGWRITATMIGEPKRAAEWDDSE